MKLSYINYFLPILLIFSSLKIFGYVLGFLFFIPFIIKSRKKIFDNLYKLSLKKKLVLYYFYFQIIQAIIGAIVISDARILIYWIPFYIVCIYIYYINKINIIKDKFYGLNIFSILYNSSLLYFILYFLFNIFSYLYFGNSYDIQDNFWIGSSAAFNISSILLFSSYNLWSKENFKLNSKYNYSFIFFIFVTNINDSRLGALYIACFMFILLIKHIQIRKFVNIILLLTIYLSSFQISSYYVGFVNSYTQLKKENKIDWNTNHFSHGSQSLFNILGDSSIKFYKENKLVLENDNFRELTPDTTRFISLLIAKEKFNQSNLYVKLFGSGWYTSRITINEVNDQFAEKYKYRYRKCPDCMPRNKVNQLQGVVSILLDTGLIGICLTGILYFFNLKNIFFLKSDLILKLFYISLLLIHFLILFIGYPLNNIGYILCLMPGGLFNYKE